MFSFKDIFDISEGHLEPVIARSFASDGVQIKGSAPLRANGRPMARQCQEKEEYLFLMLNYFTNKPKCCFL